MPLGTNTEQATEPVEETPIVNDTAEDVVEDTEEPIEEVEEENLPEISFVIEDGSGVSDANTYCDLDYALEYAVMKGYDSWKELTEEQQKVFLIRGTEYIDNFYTWKGRKRTEVQALHFPRVELYDIDRFEVRGIPLALKKACIEAAFLNSTSASTTLFNTTDANGEIKKQKVDSLEVEYFSKTQSGVSADKVDYTSIYDILNKLLKGLYRTSDTPVGITARVRWVD